MNTTTIYYHSASYAREHGELDQYRESNKYLHICGNDIETIISARFDGAHLAGIAVPEVLAIHGPEAVSILLACTVINKEWDGRFSRSNKEWAHTIRLPDRTDSFCLLYLNTHPAILNGFIDLYRKATA